MLLIFYFSSQNAEQSTQTSAWFLQFLPFSMHIVRKLAHFTIYAMLGFNTFYMYKNYGVKHYVLYALVTCILYAAVMNGINLLSQEEAHKLQTYALILAVLYP